MKRVLTLLALGIALQFNQASAQCTTTNATTCVCPPGQGTDCDLLPDITVSKDAISNSGGTTEYAQTGAGTNYSGQGSDDGRLRLTGATPNIGYGPIEVRGQSRWVCGTDTSLTYPGVGGCPNGMDPKQVVVQRIYHKNGNAMSFTDRLAGTMTYHSTHGHQHVDSWGEYTIRLENPNEPDPRNWSIVGTGSKLAFCLLDLSNCNSSAGYCRDSLNTVLNSTNLPNYGLGGGSYGCSNALQGITAGYVDIYSKSLDGMWINIPSGTCNGNYWIVVTIDPNENFLEYRENNNVIAVPITLTRQATSNPIIEIMADKSGTIAQGETIRLTATAGTAYLWSTGATTQSIEVNTSGTYSVTVTTYCGTVTSTPFNVTVIPNPNDPTVTSATICQGQSATISANASSGTVYWYTQPSGNSLPVGNGPSYTTPTLGGTTTYYAQAEEVTPGPVNFCSPTDNTFGSGAYYTSAGTPYVVFTAYSSFVLQSVQVYAGAAGNRTFQLYDKNATLVRQVTVNLPAGKSRAVLNITVPVGEHFRLQVSGTPNLWYNTTGVSYPYTLPGFMSVTNSSAGKSTYYFFYDWQIASPDIITRSARVPVTVTVNPTPVVNASAAQSTLCSGLSVGLSASGADTYVWSPATGLSGTTGSAVNASPTTSTVYTVTGTSNGCSATQTLSLTVNPSPSATLSTSNVTCNGGSNGSLQANVSGGTAPFNYSWNTSPVQTGATASNLSSGAYTVSISDANGCTTSVQGTISQPAALNLSSSVTPVICGQANSGAIDLTVSGGNAPYSYSWSNGATSEDLSNLNSGNFTVTITDASSCTGSQTFNVGQVGTAPATPASVNGAAAVCNNQSLTYSVPAVPGASTYNWTFPSGFTITGGAGSNSVTVSASNIPASGQICVTAQNACGTSAPVCFTVAKVTARPATPAAIVGANIICPGSTVSFSVAADPMATSYNWQLPTGATVVSGQGTNSISFTLPTPFTTGTLRCTPSNCLGAGGTRTMTVYGTPTTPGTISGPTNGVCAGSTNVNYSVSLVPSASSYVWSAPPGATITSGAGTNAVTVTFSAGFTGGNLTVATVNSCGTSSSRVAYIRSKPVTPGSINGTLTGICSAGAMNFSISPVTGATGYSWNVPSGISVQSGAGTTSIGVNVSPAFVSGNLCVTASNLCGNSPQRCAALTAKPAVPSSISGPTAVCANQTNVAFSTASVSGATTYNWVVPSGATIASGAGTNSILVNFGANGGTVSVNAGNGCGNSSNRNMAVAINCRSAATATTSGNISAFPNPASELLTVQVDALEKSNSRVMLRDLTGRIVLQQDLRLIAGLNQINLDVHQLARGVYVLELGQDDQRESLRVVLQ